MVTRVYTACLNGLEAQLVEVELNCRPGLPQMVIVGLADRAVLEARERLNTLLRAGKWLNYNPQRITINLAPAEVHKAGTGFDVAMLTAYAVATSQVKFDTRQTAFIGEMSLDGQIRPVRGTLILCEGLVKAGFNTIYIPKANISELYNYSSERIVPVANITELLGYLSGQRSRTQVRSSSELEPLPYSPSWDGLKGQVHAKRAAVVAAAGGHNILLTGVPGVGKTSLAACIASLLPPLTVAAQWELAKIYSACNLPIPSRRPVRTPHHTTSAPGLLGGGSVPRPGEVTLAHQGILLLDEVTEFPRATLEALRQVLETRESIVNRLHRSYKFPADFQLVATCNPCPCGYYSDPDVTCRCSVGLRDKYLQRLSRPLRERIDLTVHMYREQLDIGETDEDLKVVAGQILAANSRQKARFNGSYTNASAPFNSYRAKFGLSLPAEKFLLNTAQQHYYSARTVVRVVRVARTIADLANRSEIEIADVAEALTFRGDYTTGG